MAPQVPLVSSKKTVAALRRLGFTDARTEGSHMTMKRKRDEGGFDITVVVLGMKEIPRGTLRQALALGGVTVEEFSDALR